MADPLSIAASIVGISATGFRVSSALFKFAGDVGSAGKDARQMGTEISCLCTVLQVLGTTLEEADAISALQCGSLTQRLTNSCEAIFDEISSLVEELQPYVNLPGETAPKLAARVKWAFQKSRIVYLRASLESYKNTLNLTLSTLDLARRMAKRRISTASIVDLVSDSHQESRIRSLELAQRASIAELQELEKEASAFSTTEGAVGQRLSWAAERNSQWLYDEQLSLRRWSSHLIGAQDAVLAGETPQNRTSSRHSRRRTQIFDGAIQAPPSPIVEELAEPMNPSFTTLSWDQTTLGEDNSKTIAVVRDWLDTLSAEDRLEAWGGLVPSGYSIRYGDGPEPTTTPLFSVHEDPRPRTPPTNSSPFAVQVPRLAPSTTNEESQITSATPSSNSVPEINTPQVEVFKNFRVSIDDPCYKVLPLALKKYNITADWRQYALYIVFEDQERCLGLHEKPLIIFKLLDREGKAPMFMLRKHPAPVEGHTSIINPGEISRSSSPNNLTQVPEVFI